MRKRAQVHPIGAPSVRKKESFASWPLEELRSRKKIFLPGSVVQTDFGDIPGILPIALVKTGARESVVIHFEQATKAAHLKPSAEVERIRAKAPVRRFGMLVTSSSTFGKLLGRVDDREDGRLGRVEIRFWLGVEGRKNPYKSTPMKAFAYGRRSGRVALKRVRPAMLPFLNPYCPEWYCLNPLCHSHWFWFPGVPASTSCHGLCLWGGPCQCWMTGVPAGWAANCNGFKTCWC